MREVNIGPASDFSDPGRRIIESDGVEVGVFRLDDAFFAYPRNPSQRILAKGIESRQRSPPTTSSSAGDAS